MNIDPKKLAEQYTPKQIKSLKTDRQLCTIRFSPDGRLLAAGCQDGSIRRWDEQFADLPPLKGHSGWVQTIAFHVNGKYLFSADTHGALRCWSVAENEPRAHWVNDKAHDGWIRSLAIAPDGKAARHLWPRPEGSAFFRGGWQAAARILRLGCRPLRGCLSS